MLYVLSRARLVSASAGPMRAKRSQVRRGVFAFEAKERKVSNLFGCSFFNSSNLFGCSSMPSVPIWESATTWRLSDQEGCRLDAQASPFGEASLRPPVRRSSHHLETQKRHAFDHHLEVESPFGDSRRQETRVRGLKQPLPSRPTECERGRAEVLGTFSARAPRRSASGSGAAAAQVHPLGSGGV